MFRQQRIEDRGPIRRYKKVRPDRRKGSRSPRPVVGTADAISNADASMGSGSSPPPASPSAPTGSPILPPSSPFRVTVLPSHSRLRTFIVVGVFALFIVGIAIPLISVGNTVSSFSRSFQGAGPASAGRSNSGGPSSSAPANGGPPKATLAPRHVSYLTAAGARVGLAQIARRAPGARVSLVRIAAASISATARLPNGSSELIALLPTGPLVAATPSSGQRSLPIKQIRPGVVARLVAAIRTRFHVPVSRIDYMVLSSPVGLPIHWILFTKAPSHPGYSASLSGSNLIRLP